MSKRSIGTPVRTARKSPADLRVHEDPHLSFLCSPAPGVAASYFCSDQLSATFSARAPVSACAMFVVTATTIPASPNSFKVPAGRGQLPTGARELALLP